MRKLKRATKVQGYADYYSSDFLIRSEKNFKRALTIITIAFGIFIVALACVFFLGY